MGAYTQIFRVAIKKRENGGLRIASTLDFDAAFVDAIIDDNLRDFRRFGND